MILLPLLVQLLLLPYPPVTGADPNCASPTILCYEVDVAGNKMTPVNAKPDTATTVALDITDPDSWKLEVWYSTVESCEIHISSKLKITCGGGTQQTEPVLVNVESAVDTVSSHSKYNFASTTAGESVADALALYKEDPLKLKVVATVGGQTTPYECDYRKSLYNIECADQANTDKPIVAAEPTKTGGMFKCNDATNKYIFLGAEWQNTNEVYCSTKGWIKKGETTPITPENKGKAYCSNMPHPPMFTDCTQAAPGEFDRTMCISFDTVPPSKLERIVAASGQHNGAYLEMNDDKQWTLTLSWPLNYDTCKFKFGDKLEFNCNPDQAIPAQQNVGIVKVEYGRDTDNTMHRAKFTLSSSSEDPIFDLLQLYTGDGVVFKMEWDVGGTAGQAESAPIRFGISCPDPKSAGKPGLADKPVRDTNEANKFACPTADKHIFIKSASSALDVAQDNTHSTAVFCSKRGWRGGDHVFKKDPANSIVFCHPDAPFQKQMPFQKCATETKRLCYPVDGFNPTNLGLTANNQAETRLGLELDKTDDKKWIVTVVRKDTEGGKFKIGTALEVLCRQPKDSVKEYGAVNVKVVEELEHEKDASIRIEVYEITPKDPQDTVIDALKLYTNRKQFMILEDDKKYTSLQEYTFYEKCAPGSNPKPGAPFKGTEVLIDEENKITCSGRNDDVHLDDKFTGKSTVYCSPRGWRARDKSSGDLVWFRDYDANQKFYCYTQQPDNALPIFVGCGSLANKLCFGYDPQGATTTKDVNAYGMEIDMKDVKQWKITIKGIKSNSCKKITIGPLTFDCGKPEGDTTEKRDQGVIVKKSAHGTNIEDVYELYTITPEAPEEPVLDVLKLYMQPSYKVILTVEGLEPLEDGTKFIDDCVVKSTGVLSPVSEQAQLADRSGHNRFDCALKPKLPEIYLNANKYGASLWCSQRGWRKENGDFIEALNAEGLPAPFCYTQKPNSALPMFTDCDANLCYFFDDNNSPVLANANKALAEAKKLKRGVELIRTSTTWTLVVAHDNSDDFAFKIGESTEFTIKSKNTGDKGVIKKWSDVTVTYEKFGQDGMIHYYKFLLTPPTGESIVDALGLYANKHYKITLNFGTQSFQTIDIPFFEKCVQDYATFFLQGKGVIAKDNGHNKYYCEDANNKALFLDKVYKGITEVYCSEKGWRDEKGKHVADFSKEMVFCYNLCSQDFMVVQDAVNQPSPKAATVGTDYDCRKGHAWLQIANKFYKTVHCESNEWKADGTTIIEQKKEAKYKFEAKCVGTFSYIGGNCPKDELDKGCALPTNNDEVMKCDDGYALIYNNKIYKSLKVEKDQWKDDVDAVIGKAGTEKPKCVSKCAPINIDKAVPSAAGEKWRGAAKYSWDKALNTGVLGCEEPTDFLISDILKAGREESFFDNWECDGKKEWKSGTKTKDLKAIQNPADLKFKAHCFQACAVGKVVDDCPGKKECIKRVYSDHKLSCSDDEKNVMLINGNDINKKRLECKAKGWFEEGKDTVLPEYDHTDDAKRNAVLKVTCFGKCSEKFLEKGSGVKYDEPEMTCTQGTHMIRYKSENANQVDTLKDLTCVHKGWKAGSNLVIDFNTNGYKLKAECVESCTNALIKPTCTDPNRCKTPQLTNGQIKCSAQGSVLYSSGKVEYNSIECTKDSFKNAAGTISVTRDDPTTTIAVDCYSKCDEKFMELKDDGTVAKPTKTPDTAVPGKYDIACKPLQYTKLIIDKDSDIAHFTATKFTCNPLAGWSASDVDPKPLVAFSTTHIANGAATCFDFCVNRHKLECKAATAECVDPRYAAPGEITCGLEHTMRVLPVGADDTDDNYVDMIQETLECKNEGYKRKSKTGDPPVLAFTTKNTGERFNMYCLSNCNHKLVTIKDGVPYLNNELTCTDDQILILALTSPPATATRVFGPAKCVKAEGWMGLIAKQDKSDAEEKKIVDFKKEVRIEASCQTVCSEGMLEDTGSGPECDAIDYKGTAKTLGCRDNYQLFVKHPALPAIMETGPLTCSVQGWKEDTAFVINFLDTTVDIAGTVSAACKHKCHPDFITDSCDAARKTAKECDTATYKDRKLSCKGATQILVLEHDTGIKEAFESAKCSDKGWEDEKATSMFDLSNPAAKYQISARCEDVCHPNTLTDDNKADRDYELGGKLTCTSELKKLLFDGHDWYTDLTCSKKGWVSTSDTTKKMEFTANQQSGTAAEPLNPRRFKAECVASACVRPLTTLHPCAGQSGPCPAKPDWITQKYQMTCESPARIVKISDGQQLTYDKLYCINDIWYNKLDPATTAILKADEDFDPKCHAGDCALCTEIDLVKIACNAEPNCQRIEYKPGAASYCANLKCTAGGHYKVETEGKIKYYAADSEIKCYKGPKAYLTPDQLEQINEISKFGCVNWIPCVEHSPIDTKCTDVTVGCNNADLDAQLQAGSHFKSTDLGPITCSSGYKLYHRLDDANRPGDIVWSELAELKCLKNGIWSVGYVDTEVEAKELPRTKTGSNYPRVVCAERDPSTYVPTTTPKPAPCDDKICKIPELLKCDVCETDRGKLKTNAENGICKLTSTTRRIIYNDNKEETKDPLICKANNGTGEFDWRTADGKVVKKLAAIEREQDKVDMAMIGGIVGGTFVLLALIAGFLIYVRIHKKREAQRLETLKSKGLEQKNDTIIDSVTIIEDPKTIRL